MACVPWAEFRSRRWAAVWFPVPGRLAFKPDGRAPTTSPLPLPSDWLQKGARGAAKCSERGKALPALCYFCYMARISHRELRNNSADVLRRVAGGEVLTVTNHGEPVAVIGPIRNDTVEELSRRGQVRQARVHGGFTSIEGATGISSREVLDDLRGNL